MKWSLVFLFIGFLAIIGNVVGFFHIHKGFIILIFIIAVISYYWGIHKQNNQVIRPYPVYLANDPSMAS